MNRRNRTLIVVGLAVVLATLASYLVFRAVQSIPVREITVVERQQVVAVGRIEPGSVLTPAEVRLTAWPADSPVPGGFEQVEDVVGRSVMALILPNEPVTESKLAIPEAGVGLQTQIPEGMRAVTVRVNEIVGVSGFIRPQSRVDIIAIGDPDTRGTLSRIVLEYIEVVAVGPATSVPEEEGARPTSAATVLVTPEDSERLALAASEGQIIMALRNRLDVIESETQGVRLAEVFAGPNPPPVRTVNNAGRARVTTPPPPPAPPRATMNIIMGASRKTVEVEPTGGGSAGSGS